MGAARSRIFLCPPMFEDHGHVGTIPVRAPGSPPLVMIPCRWAGLELAGVEASEMNRALYKCHTDVTLLK